MNKVFRDVLSASGGMHTVKNLAPLESLVSKLGFTDYKIIDPKVVTIGQWVRMKCMFGCDEYGRNASCPPNVPTIEECRAFFGEYQKAMIFHFNRTLEDPDERHEWSREINSRLLAVERETFLSGYYRAFLLFMDSCALCKKCSGIRSECKEPKRSRPTPEAMGVDVFATMRAVGYPIDVLADYKEEMNRYALLLLE
jgi:predicted metal-binding protein